MTKIVVRIEGDGVGNIGKRVTRDGENWPNVLKKMIDDFYSRHGDVGEIELILTHPQ